MNFFQHNGYRIIPQQVKLRSIALLKRRINEYIEYEPVYGIRDLHLKIKAIALFGRSNLIQDILHEHTNNRQFKLIKAIFFNKNLQHNWAVPWHQDKTIAVREKKIIPGYKNWTTKQGVPHVQPPSKILEKNATIRIALDDTNIDNGALKVIPRSHQLGILNQTKINHLVREESPVICNLKAGDILLMSPLILHSSSRSTHNTIDILSR